MLSAPAPESLNGQYSPTLVPLILHISDCNLSALHPAHTELPCAEDSTTANASPGPIPPNSQFGQASLHGHTTVSATIETAIKQHSGHHQHHRHHDHHPTKIRNKGIPNLLKNTYLVIMCRSSNFLNQHFQACACFGAYVPAHSKGGTPSRLQMSSCIASRTFRGEGKRIITMMMMIIVIIIATIFCTWLPL